jgi:hypothetical protein
MIIPTHEGHPDSRLQKEDSLRQRAGGNLVREKSTSSYDDAWNKLLVFVLGCGCWLGQL